MKTVICVPRRTPIGSFQGSLSQFNAPFLGAEAIRASLGASGLSPSKVDEVFMGCVLTAGLGQAPARQAALGAGVDRHTPCTTVGKVCGSGLKAVMLADSAIRSGEIRSAIAGGMESMSQSPYLIPKLRDGLRMGNSELIDSMIKDGLWDIYNDFHMGNAAEICVREYKLTREEQDAYAHASYERAIRAQKDKLFAEEIVPLILKTKKGDVTISEDEGPTRYKPEKASGLKPSFESTGTITPFNASSLNDGAAAMIVCSEEFAIQEKLVPLARIVAQGQAAQAPEWFTTAPTPAIQASLKRAGLKIHDIDFWEINEAFAAVAIVNQRLLEIDPARINAHGGAIALGHPIGASGARILVTLLHTLKQEKKRYGCASLCIGGGEGISLIVENLVR
ncbi:MAG: thiolase family protein [Bdellovibrionota bacterium]